MERTEAVGVIDESGEEEPEQRVAEERKEDSVPELSQSVVEMQ